MKQISRLPFRYDGFFNIRPFKVLVFLWVFLFIGACSQTKFASSFGKRKYNKGYYFDRHMSSRAVCSVKRIAKHYIGGDEILFSDPPYKPEKVIAEHKEAIYSDAEKNNPSKIESRRVGNGALLSPKLKFETNPDHGDNSQLLSSLSFAAGVLSIISVSIPLLIILSPVAITIGIIALHKIAKYPDKYGGQWMAIVGLILGIISLTYILILIIIPTGP